LGLSRYRSLILLSILLILESGIFASCGGNTRTWSSTSNRNWSAASNWTPNNSPDTASEDAIIINTGVNSRVDTDTTVGCVDIQSGIFQGSVAATLSVTGDYFRAPNQNTMSIGNNAFVIEMAGTSTQTFTANDDIRDLKISNPSEVTLVGNFRILSDFIFENSGKTYITGDVTQFNNSATTTIPAGHTLVIKSGASLFMRGDLVVNGVLIIEAGALLRFYRNKGLKISSGAILQVVGAQGNPAKITSEATAKSFSFTMNGQMSANNFVILRPDNNGMNINGTVSILDNGQIRGIANNGYGIVLGSSSSIPTSLNSIGFFNDDAYGTVRNINASNYTGSSFNVTDYSGDVAGASFELDPSNKVNWIAPAITEIGIINDAAANEPAQFFDPGDEFTFAELAFSLTQVDTATDITSLDITMTGTASMSDLESVTAYLDTNGSCNYNAANDTLIGTLNFSGSPPKAKITLNPGDLQTAGPSDQTCIIIRAKADASPTDQKTVRFGVMSSSDITNSQGYPVSSTSGTPIESGYSTIRNSNYAAWNGSVDSLWSNANNWRSNNLPTSTLDCQIGAALNPAQINTTTVSCANATLQTSGEIDWNGTSNSFDVYSTLDVQSNFIFSNATNGIITFKGVNNQGLNLATFFPGSMILNNTGASDSNILSIESDSYIGGNFTCTSGVLYIPTGVNFKVAGNLSINSGCSLQVDEGAILSIGNGSSITIANGASFILNGSSSALSQVKGINTSDAISISVNGTISAYDYSISNLSGQGLLIGSGATIDTVKNLSHGSFLYPATDNTTFITLNKFIPTNTLEAMVFDSNGSTTTNITNIDTSSLGSGVLNITSYSGDLSGPTYDNDPSYVIDWQGQTNTIELQRVTLSPASVTVGNTYNIGTFSLKQTQAGASYNDTNITSLKVTLTGTGTANDIQSAGLYIDSDCDGVGGSFISSSTFAGNPATITYSITPGLFVVAADTTTTVRNCFYIEYQIASGGTNNSTVGAKIASANDIINSESYSFASNASPPLTAGTPAVIDAPSTTIWTGSLSTDWANNSNWSSGVPDATKTCQISSTVNAPTITGAGACKNLDIVSGTLTIGASATLSLDGNLSNLGTINQSGTIAITDGGVNKSHTLNSATTLTSLTISKTGGGTIDVNDTELIINNITVTGANYSLTINSNKKLILPNGINLNSGELKVSNGGTLEIGSGKNFNLQGGRLTLYGTNDTFPQGQTTKGKITSQGSSGTWNFNATSGEINFSGFHVDRLSPTGLLISGTTSILNLKGGQFTNLSASYSSVKAIQINTTGTIPASAANIAWTWGNFNEFDPATTNTPNQSDPYTLISSNGCNSQSIDFTGWTGDWYETSSNLDVTTKISSSNCNITMSNAATAVSLKELKAIPYADAVQIVWQTNTEINHIGFNVYRSNKEGSVFQQINKELIKNFEDSTSAKGNYSFNDYDVQDKNTYYYYIEDLEVSGMTRLHGPVWATVDSTLSNAPTPGGNTGSNPDNPDDGGSSSPTPIKNPSYRDLGNGAVIINQTTNALRIEITPATMTYANSSWNNNYEDIDIAGYAKTDRPNYPALPKRIILIDADNYSQTAEVLSSSIIENSIVTNKLVSPLPDYKMINGILTPAFEPDPTAYTSTINSPSTYFEVSPELIKEGDKKFIKVTIYPVQYNANSREIHSLQKLTLDIGIDGNDWNTTPPDSYNGIGVNNIANTIKMNFKASGMAEVTYDNLKDSDVHLPVESSQVDQLRVFHQNQEIPIQVISNDSLFNSGDSIRFFSSDLDSLTLSDKDLINSGNNPLRIEVYDATPLSQDDNGENRNRITQTFEENKIYIDGQSLGDTEDHFFWQQIQNYTGLDKFSKSVSGSRIDLNSDENIIVKFGINPLPGYYGNEFFHHVQLSINGNEIEDRIIQDNIRQDLSFDINPLEFSSGANTIELKVLGTFAVNGDYDRVLINNLTISYLSNNHVQNNSFKAKTDDLEVNNTLTGFTNSDISIYEITGSRDIRLFKNTLIESFNAGASYQVSYYLDDTTDDNFEKIIFAQTDNFLQPISLSINRGFDDIIEDEEIDLILIGAQSLLYASQDYIEHRRSTGLTVKTITTESIYNKYGNGTRSDQAIDNFFKDMKSWTYKPRYLIMLGDSTYDPNNHNIDDNDANEITALETETIPSKMTLGRFMEYYTDNSYSLKDNSFFISIGRIPSNSPEEITNYFQKVISYEQGDGDFTSLKKVSFAADKDLGYYEDFDLKAQNFANSLHSFSSNIIRRSDYSTKDETREKIIDMFNSNNFIISMLGHGASDRFGDGILLNSHVASLENKNLPMVLMWNCETGYFYDANKTEKSFGESLIFNQFGGAILYIGPTSQTTPTAQYNFASTFYTNLEQAVSGYYQGQRVGDILIKTQNTLKSSTYDHDIVLSTVILGDPSLSLNKSLFKTRNDTNKDNTPKAGGCSAIASGGNSIPWYSGLLELLICALLITGFRRLFDWRRQK